MSLAPKFFEFWNFRHRALGTHHRAHGTQRNLAGAHAARLERGRNATEPGGRGAGSYGSRVGTGAEFGWTPWNARARRASLTERCGNSRERRFGIPEFQIMRKTERIASEMTISRVIPRIPERIVRSGVLRGVFWREREKFRLFECSDGKY